MGYDLLKAGYDYSTTDDRNEVNTEIINGIAEDFVKASVSKAGIAVNKEEIIHRIHDAGSPVRLTPIVILSVTNKNVISIKFINKTSPLFKDLFVED
jgi:hypothetical protein